jgi:hypothetical protein
MSKMHRVNLLAALLEWKVFLDCDAFKTAGIR